jgi:two-component system chemotaxis sensor kinase CheA
MKNKCKGTTNLSIRNRLYLGFASISIMIALFSWIVINLMSSMNSNAQEISNTHYSKVKASNEIELEIRALSALLERLLLFEGRESIQREIEEKRESVNESLEVLSLLVDTMEGEALFTEMVVHYRLFDKATNRFVHLASAGEVSKAKQYLATDTEASRVQLFHSLSAFTLLQERRMEQEVKDTDRQFQLALSILWGAIAVLLVLCWFTALGVVRSTVRSIRHISGVMNRVKMHDFDSLPRMEVRINDEISSIAVAFNRMADALEEQAEQEAEYKQTLEDQNWVKTHVALTKNLYQGERDLPSFAQRFLSHVVPVSGAVAGAFYYIDANDPEQRLVCLSVYAGNRPDEERKTSFAIGEGLTGQCAALGSVIETQAPPGYLRIVSGLGETEPVHLLLLPVLYEGQVVAVLELASFISYAPLQRIFLDEVVSGSLGVSIHNLSNHMRIQRLLGESQQYVEELQTQSEELQQQQEELRSLNDRLAEQIKSTEQRSHELEQMKTEMEKKANELQISSQFKSEFLANMSHELRTPLNSLLILAQMLGDNPDHNLTPKQQEYAKTILYSGNELLALINDILDLSKIEAGQMELAQDPFIPLELAEELRRQFDAVAEKRGLTFQVQVDENIRETVCIADQQRLGQILNNLLSNAFKFTEKGSVSLRIFEALQEGTLTEHGIGNLSFEIQDTGIGIPEDKQEMIFEAFRQADGKTNRKYGGTGLGLAISKELVLMMGGTIHLYSEIGTGSTFTVTIPMRMKASAALLEVAADSAAAVGAMTELPEQTVIRPSAEEQKSAGKILLVDDDIRNVYALSAALIEHHYEVVYAENGRVSLDILNQHHDIDLVLMDMMMPELDGYEAMREIRSNPVFETLPVIAVTAKAMNQDRELCIEAGANDYISKPVKLDQLFSLIQVWMHGRRTGE